MRRLALLLALLASPALAQGDPAAAARDAAQEQQQAAPTQPTANPPVEGARAPNTAEGASPTSRDESPGALAREAPQQQQQAPGLSSGDPSVQSTAPEVGAGRGALNAPPPTTSEPQAPSGGERPAAAATAPQAPAPAPPIEAGIPFTGRGGSPAAEQELEAALRGGQVIGGRVSIPNQSAGILIQPDGRDWRQFRNQPLVIAGAVAVIGTLLVLALFHLIRGPIRIRSGRSGRTVQRFNLFERVNHWMTATSFVLLALTGLNITFGAWVLRPVIGPEAFTALTFWGQAVHHYVAFAFVVGIVLMLVIWAAQNLPTRRDVEYIAAGGPFGSRHVPTGRFNAGQKGLFWLVVAGGAAVSVSGFLLMAPGLLDNVIGQQWSHIVHGLLAMGMIAVIIGHAYIGSIGMEGAFEAMRDGHVDQNWAREHHDLWLEQKLDEARRTVGPEPRRNVAPAE
jgi:formate dehydrogenase subunit gamma